MSNAPQTAPSAPLVLVSQAERVATLVLNRPERLNALNGELAAAINEALGRIAEDKGVRAVVMTGAGRAFCAGGDLAAIRAGRDSGDLARLEPILRGGMQMVLRMRTMPQPVVAAVNGPAAGAGMNIALAADIRIAAADATFGQNFAKVGLFPDYGGIHFLPQLVGPSRAAQLFYTGDMIDAQTALQIGVINRVVPPERLEAEARALAQKIAAGPPIAVQAVKRAIFGTERAELEAALETEVRQQMLCFQSEDCGEGVRAFFEKRAPKFQGR
ncbi:MAG TPA: enoyl-CoA hydratase-related protein [Methylomirabilota bacterium]|nr:enoyl-CoA hydratase-related protein [Methylomirabilota bacterium]